jgi:hypothetical protein
LGTCAATAGDEELDCAIRTIDDELEPEELDTGAEERVLAGCVLVWLDGVEARLAVDIVAFDESAFVF